MRLVEKTIVDLISEGRDQDYIGIIRSYTGHLQSLMKLGNPMGMEIFILHLEELIPMISSELRDEIDWLNRVVAALILYKDDICQTNHLLGITNDNQYNTEAFRELIVEKFMFGDVDVKSHDYMTITIRQIEELIEMGVRRYYRF
jgi:hypothetical protein